MSKGLGTFTSDPGLPILVEGPRDEELIRQLVRNINGKYSISNRGGDTEVLKAVNLLVDVSIPRIGVILDLDERSPKEVYEQCYGKLDGNHHDVSKLDGNRISIGQTSIVHVGYAGLPEDPDISVLSIEKHAIEDHILKLLLNKNETVRRISNSEISDSESLKSAVLDIESDLEDHFGEIDKGKIHLEIAKITLGYNGPTGSFIYDLLQCSEIDYQTHASTKGLLSIFENMSST